MDAQQINIFDDRFYFINDVGEVQEEFEYLKEDGGIYMPSSTHILDVAYSKGAMFNEWLKSVGHSAKTIAEIAAEKGTRVHKACEMLLAGQELSFDTIIEVDRKHTGKYMSLEEWEGVIRFKEFYDFVKPTDVVSESIVWNKDLYYAGTVDIQCTIGTERWLIDIKFSNAIYESYYLQIESYARCVDGIDRVGLLHLKAKTRGERKGKIQGKGWQLIEPQVDRDELFKTWLSLLQIYKFKNGGEMPKSISYPKTIKL